LVLAAVFAVAGVAKLSDREGSRQAVVDFGIPASLAAPLGILVPLAELAVAAALIPTPTALWGALGALVLLLLFIGGIGANLARGRKPECHCFGQLHSAPAGFSTLARNGVLAVVAAFLLWRGLEGEVGPSVVGWIAALSPTQVLIVVVGMVVVALVGAQWIFLFGLLRQNGRLLGRLGAIEERLAAAGLAPSETWTQPTAGLPVGAEAPAFALKDLGGEEVTLDGLRSSDKPVMLLFIDPDCKPCNALLPEIGHWQEEHSEKLTISLISGGDPEANRAKSSEHGLSGVLLQEDWELVNAYEAVGAPNAVIVEPDGTIGSPVVRGAPDIRSLLAQAVGERAQLPMHPATQEEPCPNCGKVHAAAPTVPAALRVGEPAPEIKLPNLEGEDVDLAGLRGEETLLLFWNPGCGFCQQMLPDLKDWEANRPEGAPKLLVVSAGTEEANREQGLVSTVVLDQQFAVGQAFGSSGTPSAVLIDAEGKVASELALGAPAVLELAGMTRTRP